MNNIPCDVVKEPIDDTSCGNNVSPTQTNEEENSHNQALLPKIFSKHGKKSADMLYSSSDMSSQVDTIDYSDSQIDVEEGPIYISKVFSTENITYYNRETDISAILWSSNDFPDLFNAPGTYILLNFLMYLCCVRLYYKFTLIYNILF